MSRADLAATPPRLSLIVATTGRIEDLRRLFASLVAQSASDFEVVLVDQSRDLTTNNLAEEFRDQLSLIYVRDTGRGLSRARNLGLRHARSICVAFPDDDCWYPTATVSTVLAFFDAHPNVAIFSGIYTEPERINPNFPAIACVLSPQNLWGKGCSVGLFINRTAIGELSVQFDERIGAGTNMPAGEEIDLMLRLLQARVPGYYDPSLVIYHAIHRQKVVSRETFAALRKAFWYVIGKNYQPVYSEVKVARGALGCFLRVQPYGVRLSISAMLSGYKTGLSMRGASNSTLVSADRQQ